MFAKQSLAIGIKHHDLRRLNLEPCIHDAQDVTSALRSIGFKTMIGADLTIRQCRKYLDSFIGSIVPGAVVVFYFSGHGVQWQGRNYLVPSDARGLGVETLSEKALDAQLVIEALHKRRPRLVICILDCCRTDAPMEPLDSWNRFGQSLPRDGPGLAAMKAGPATLIAFACAADDTASANSFNERNSLYTAHLLRYITQRGVDIERVLKFVARDVEAESERSQIPYRYSSCNESIFLADGVVQKDLRSTRLWHDRDSRRT